MKKTLFALAALVAAYSSTAAALYYVQVPEGTSGAVMKTIDGNDYWLKPIDLSGNISVAYDASWWYTPAKSSVKAITVNLKKADGSSLGDITISPTDTEKAVYNSIRSKVPVSAANAYEAAAVALAKSMYNEIQTKFLRENVDTIAKTLQANMISGAATEYGEYTTSDGSTVRVVDSTWLPDLQNMTQYASQLQQFRESFGTSGNGNVSVGKTSLVLEGTVGLGGGGGGVSQCDGVSVTNMKFWVGGVQSNTLALAGWWKDNYRSNGGPAEDFICDYTLAEFAKDPSERDSEFNRHYLLTRTRDGLMHYIPMTNSISVAVKPDNASIQTNADGSVSLWGVTNAAAVVSVAEFLSANKDEDPDLVDIRTNMCVVARYAPDGKPEEGYDLYYIPIGGMKGNLPDMKSIDISEIGSTSNKLEMAGFAAATNSASEAKIGEAFSDRLFGASAAELHVPVKQGEGIAWLPLGNYDINERASGLEASAASNAMGIVERKFELANWSEVTNQAASAYSSIASLLGGENKTAATNLMILAKDLTTEKLEYILLGDMSVGVDEKSIASTNLFDEATGKSNTVHMIKGFYEASDGQVPMKVVDDEGAEKVVWTNVTASASNLVDNLTIQNWRKAGETNDLLMVKGFIQDAAQERSLDKMLAEDAPDDGSSDSNDYKFQVLTRKVRKSATFPASDTNDFALVYLDVTKGNMSTNWKNKVTNSGNLSSHHPFNPAETNINGAATVTGVTLNPDTSLDNRTITTNSLYALELMGFREADGYTVPFIDTAQDVSAEKILKWEQLPFADNEVNVRYANASAPNTIVATDTQTPDSSYDLKMLSLYGFENAAVGKVPVKAAGTSSLAGGYLDWTDFVRGVDDSSITTNYDHGATSPYDGKASLYDWRSPASAGTTLNAMLTDDSEASNRANHKFLARYQSDGGDPSVHWVGIDGVIGGSPVDNASITTNYSAGASSDGVASIFGFSTASAEDVPHKNSDGSITWKPVASGGALIVEGTSGSTVTSATCTNKLSFVSASDSNVKFTVTDAGNGNVTVTIGVYYK